MKVVVAMRIVLQYVHCSHSATDSSCEKTVSCRGGTVRYGVISAWPAHSIANATITCVLGCISSMASIIWSSAPHPTTVRVPPLRLFLAGIRMQVVVRCSQRSVPGIVAWNYPHIGIAI
jgi:hypothetical protein